MSESLRFHDRIKDLEKEVERLKKVNESLMTRVERSTDAAGSSYSLFESNLLLQNTVKQRTCELEDVNKNLQKEIRQRSKTEDALRWERNFGNAILDVASALIVVLDRDGRIVRFNKACEQVTGYKFSEVINQPFQQFLLPEESEKIEDIFQELCHCEATKKVESYWVSKTGEKRLISWSNASIFDSEGDVEYIVAIGIDITDIKEADEKLKLYRRIFMASNDGISIIDPDGKLIELNPAHIKRMKDRKAKYDLKPGDDMSKTLEPAVLEAIQKSLRENGFYRGEIHHVSGDNNSYYSDVSIVPVNNEKDEPIATVAFTRDITQNKRDQDMLSMRLSYEVGLAACSRALLETADEDEVIPKALHPLLVAAGAGRVYIFENFSDPQDGLCTRQVYEVAGPGTSRQLDNPALQHLPYGGSSFEEWRKVLSENKHFSALVKNIPEDVASILREQGIISIIVLPIWVDGEWYGFIGFDDVEKEREWSNEEIRLLKTAADMFGGYFSRLNAIDAVRSSEERFRMLVENSNNIIFSLNPQGELTYLSPQFEQYTGYKNREFLGCHIKKMVYHDDQGVFDKWFEGVLASNKNFNSLQSRFQDKKGRIEWFITNASVIRDEDNEIVEIVGVSHDVTELKDAMGNLEKANQRQKETQAQLVQSEKMASLGMLVAGIAHEINTPIGSVGSMHDTLVRATTKLNAHLETACTKDNPGFQKIISLMKVIDDANKVIQNGTERVTAIVRRLRSFARLDEAEMDDHCDIHEGIEDTLILVHHEIKHNISINREFGDIPKIACFSGRLNQVFVNILINAKQAIKDKGEITVKTEYQDNKVYISFTDTGSGISPENLKKVFDPGFTTKGVGVGTGLGLSICYQIIQDHHGDIFVKSEVGKGTTFTIVLPDNLEKLVNYT